MLIRNLDKGGILQASALHLYKDVPRFKLHYLELLQQILKQELDYDELEEIIKRDLSLSYKLLR